MGKKYRKEGKTGATPAPSAPAAVSKPSAQGESQGERWTAIAIVVALCIAAYYRLFFGVSVGDEAHQVATAYLPAMGGHWFVDEKTIQQVACMLFSPFVLLYAKLVGTDGIMLFVRHLHFVLSLATAYCLFLLFQRYCRWSVALLLASVGVTFVVHAIPSLSYNAQGSLFFGMASALGLSAFLSLSRPLAVASGVAWVLCGFSYPTMAAPFAAFTLSGLVLGWKDPIKRKNFIFPMAAGGLAVAAILGGFLLSQGIENISSAVRYSSLFNNPGGLWKLAYAFKMIWIYMPPIYITLGLWVAWAFWGRQDEKMGLNLFLAFLVAFFWLGGLYESMPTQVLWPVLQLLILIYAFTKKFRVSSEEWAAFGLVILPAIVGSAAACLTSRMTLYVMCLTGVFGALMTTAIIIGRNKIVGWATALLLTGASIFHYYKMIYEDEPMSLLTYTIPSGPFKGLKTFEEKGKFVEAIQADLKEFNIQGKKILFKDLFPGGYMMADNIPSGPTLYIAPANFYPESRPVYAQIFRNPQFLPEVVVELAYYPVRMNDKWPYTLDVPSRFPDPFKNFFLESGLYSKLVERPTHRILVRK